MVTKDVGCVACTASVGDHIRAGIAVEVVPCEVEEGFAAAMGIRGFADISVDGVPVGCGVCV